MEERSLADLHALQISRGGDALVRVGKPLRRYARPEEGRPPSATSRRRAERSYRAVRALNLRALETLYVDEALLDDVEIDTRTPGDGFTCADDIVISLASPHAAACMSSELKGLFVPSSCAIIRIDRYLLSEADPWYIAGCLSLPSVLETLSLSSDSKKSSLINTDQVASIRIPWCDADRQRAVGEAVRAHARVLKRLHSIEATQREALAAAIARAAQTEESS